MLGYGYMLKYSSAMEIGFQREFDVTMSRLLNERIRLQNRTIT